MQVIPYFYCNGNAEELIEHYKSAFSADKVEIMRYGDLPEYAENDDLKDQVMHAEIVINGGIFYVSDIMLGYSVEAGNAIDVNINFDSVEQLEEAYNILKTGGQVVNELADTFWNARYGQIKDKFGNGWGLNYQYPEK